MKFGAFPTGAVVLLRKDDLPCNKDSKFRMWYYFSFIVSGFFLNAALDFYFSL